MNSMSIVFVAIFIFFFCSERPRAKTLWRSTLDDFLSGGWWLVAGGCWLAAAGVWRTMAMTVNNFAHADTTYYTYVNNVFRCTN